MICWRCINETVVYKHLKHRNMSSNKHVFRKLLQFCERFSDWIFIVVKKKEFFEFCLTKHFYLLNYIQWQGMKTVTIIADVLL
jgi:hypothetical protein